MGETESVDMRQEIYLNTLQTIVFLHKSTITTGIINTTCPIHFFNPMWQTNKLKQILSKAFVWVSIFRKGGHFSLALRIFNCALKLVVPVCSHNITLIRALILYDVYLHAFICSPKDKKISFLFIFFVET